MELVLREEWLTNLNILKWHQGSRRQHWWLAVASTPCVASSKARTYIMGYWGQYRTLQLYCLCVEKFAFLFINYIKHSIHFTDMSLPPSGMSSPRASRRRTPFSLSDLRWKPISLPRDDSQGDCVRAPALVCMLSEVDVAIITLCVCVCVCACVILFFCYHYL